MDFEANCGYFLKVQCFLHQISSYIIFDLQIFKLMLFYTVQKNTRPRTVPFTCKV